MTASPSPPPRGRRGLKWLVAVGALLALAAAGGGLYLLRFRPTPVPPDGARDGLEPAVVLAVRRARERVLEAPRSAEAWGTLGQVFLANDLEEEAQVCFTEAERLDPTNPRWPYYRGGPLLNQGDTEGALPFLRRAAERCEARENGAPRLRLGEALLVLGRNEEAEEQFRLVLAARPEDVRAHFDLGLLAVSRQEWKTAQGHLLRCLDNPAAGQKARIQLAVVCRRLGDLTKARELQQQAERLPADLDWADPFIAEYAQRAVKTRARYRLAEQLEAAGRPAEAVAVLQPMTEDRPDDYLPHLTLGKTLGQMGEYARAEVALRKARPLAPDKVQAHYYLSLVLFMKGEALERQHWPAARVRPVFEESADLARQALALKPDYGAAHMALGLALGHLGRRAEAVAALRQAVRCNPEHAELHFRLGEALAQEGGHAAEARARLEQALATSPPRAPWREAARQRLASLSKGEGAPGPKN